MSVEKAVEAYWKALGGPTPYLSGSHHWLADLYVRYGKEAVHAELDKCRKQPKKLRRSFPKSSTPNTPKE